MRIPGFVILLSLVSLPFFQGTASGQALIEQLEVEGKIKQKLAEQVVFLLPEEDFRIFVTAKIEKSRQKVILEGETESKTSGNKKAKTLEPLPGFQLVEDGKAQDEAVQKNQKSRYTFKTVTRVHRIDVNMVIDKAVDPEKKTFVKDLVAQEVEKSFGKVGHLKFVELDLTKRAKDEEQEASIASWFADYLARRGGSAIDLAYLAGLVILLASIGLLLYLRARKANRLEAAAAGSSSKTSEGQESHSRDVDGILDRLVFATNKNPLAVRAFLESLEPESKKALLRATRSPALKDYFARVVGQEPGSREKGAVDRTVRDLLQAVEKDLTRYLKLQEEQVKHQFGYLPLLGIPRIHAALESSSDRIGDLAIVACHLPETQIAELTKALTVEEKVELFEKLHGDTPGDERLRQVDGLLRARFEDLRKSGGDAQTPRERLVDHILDNDTQVNEVVERLTALNVPLPRSYRKYLVTFEALMTMDKAVVKRVFESVSNETLSRALAPLRGKGNWSTTLGDIRAKLIASLIDRQADVGEREIERAQLEVLKVYRKMS